VQRGDRDEEDRKEQRRRSRDGDRYTAHGTGQQQQVDHEEHRQPERERGPGRAGSDRRPRQGRDQHHQVQQRQHEQNQAVHPAERPGVRGDQPDGEGRGGSEDDDCHDDQGGVEQGPRARPSRRGPGEQEHPGQQRQVREQAEHDGQGEGLLGQQRGRRRRSRDPGEHHGREPDAGPPPRLQATR
jgi:hypothetical protein